MLGDIIQSFQRATGEYNGRQSDVSAQNIEQAIENKQLRMKGDDIACRLLWFAVRVLELVRKLRLDNVGRHVCRQLTRSATAAGANYEEARCAESRADFAHKISIAAKELRESRYWLHLIGAAKLMPTRPVNELATEAANSLRYSLHQPKQRAQRPE
jgi:four helix bundle protein